MRGLYPCVPNQVTSTTEKSVPITGNALTDAVNVTLASLKSLPTWVKIGGAIGLYLVLEEPVKTYIRRRRSR